MLVAIRLQHASQSYIIAANQVPRRGRSFDHKVIKNSELEWNSLRWLVLAWALHLYTHDSLKSLVWALHEKRNKASSKDGRTMNNDLIQDWTDAQIPLKLGDSHDVRYKVFKDGTRLFQEIREIDGTLIRKMELPQGMVMKEISYEVLCRYVLSDVANA